MSSPNGNNIPSSPSRPIPTRKPSLFRTLSTRTFGASPPTHSSNIPRNTPSVPSSPSLNAMLKTKEVPDLETSPNGNNTTTLPSSSSQSRPIPTRKPSLFRTLSTRNFGSPPTRSSTISRPSNNTPSVPSSPSLNAMLKTKEVPDLETVDRALAELRLDSATRQEEVALRFDSTARLDFAATSSSPLLLAQASSFDEGNESWIARLESISLSLRAKREDCDRYLTKAMEWREKGSYEVCRGMCFEVISHPNCGVRTKVHAYLTLVSQSTIYQKERTLKTAEALVRDHIERDDRLGQLRDTIDVLKKRVREEREMMVERERKGVMGKENRKPREEVEKLVVRVDEEADGPLSPRLAKVLDFAGFCRVDVKEGEEFAG